MRQPWGPLVNAVRTLFRGEEIHESNSGGGKDLKEFELYLPVLYKEYNKSETQNINFGPSDLKIKIWSIICAYAKKETYHIKDDKCFSRDNMDKLRYKWSVSLIKNKIKQYLEQKLFISGRGDSLSRSIYLSVRQLKKVYSAWKPPFWEKKP